MEVFIVGFILTILILVLVYYYLYLSPKYKLQKIAKLYGKDVVIQSSLLKQLISDYELKDDSNYNIRQLAKEKPHLKAIVSHLGSSISYNFCDPECIKQVHQNHEAFNKLSINPGQLFLLQNSLFFTVGTQWQKQRLFLGKSFHFDQIKNQLPVVKQLCSQAFGDISKQLKNQSEIVVDVVVKCEEVTSGVVQQSFFGQIQDQLQMKNTEGKMISISSEVVALIKDSALLTQSSRLVMLKTMLFKAKSLSIFPTKREKKLQERLFALKSACNEIIQKRKQQLIEDPSQYKYNFLDLYLKEILLNQNKDITHEEIIDNFMGLFFAGTDTTSSMVGSALYFLSMNPQIQKTAREEVLKILSCKSQSKNPSELFEQMAFEDISSMNYLHCILKETIRIIPPAVGILFRYANKDIKIGGIQVEKGNLINTVFLHNQMNPEVFPNPDVFDPNRWMDTKIHTTTNYTPFSLGQRNCIGQHLAIIEGKCMLAYILLHFEVIRNYDTKLRLLQKTTYGPFPSNLVLFKEINLQ